MTIKIRYGDGQAHEGEFRLARFDLHVFASAETDDAKGEALYETICDEIEEGLAAVARNLGEKHPELIAAAVTS